VEYENAGHHPAERAGRSYRQITAHLQAEGIRPRSGGAWHPTMATRLIAKIADAHIVRAEAFPRFERVSSAFLVDPRGFEPLTSWLPAKRSTS
jgi:hypothetical protein